MRGNECRDPLLQEIERESAPCKAIVRRKVATLTLPDFEEAQIPSKNTRRYVGSGPRGRRFKSSRPDQKSREIASVSQLLTA